MEIDLSCFDFRDMELVKKKYYNAAKVSERLNVIRARYEGLCRENKILSGETESLRAELEALKAQKSQISDTLMNAQNIARQMLDDARVQAEECERLARVRADEIILSAEKKAELLEEAAKRPGEAELSEIQDYALCCVEELVNELRRQQIEGLELINSRWQSFLGGIILPEERYGGVKAAVSVPPAIVKAAESPAGPQEPVDWMALANMELPDFEEQYDDIDADTFFSSGFFSEQSGSSLIEQELQKLRTLMNSMEYPQDE